MEHDGFSPFSKTASNLFSIMERLFQHAGYMSLLILFSFVCNKKLVAQERSFAHYSFYTDEDVRKVKQLISKGTSLHWSYPDSAIQYFREAEQLSRTTGLASGRGLALAHMGLIATETGKVELGFAYYKEALPYCLQGGPIRNALAVLYLHMGVSLHHKGDYTKANEYYYKALSLFQSGLPGTLGNIGSVHNNLSSLQILLGNYRQALRYATMAAQQGRMNNNFPLLISATINKGSAYLYLEQLDSAMQCFRSARLMARHKGHISMEQASLINIGEMMMNKGQYSKALHYFREAMQLSSATNPYYGAIVPGYNAANALLQLREYGQAEQLLLVSIQKAEQAGVIEKKGYAYNILSSLYEATGAHRKALHYYRLYEQLKDSLTNVEKIRAMNELEIKYNTARNNQELARKELKIALQQKQLSKTNTLIGGIIGGIVLITIIFIGIYRYRQKIGARDREIERLEAMMAGEEKERGRISRELHDGIGGMLAGIKMNLKTIQKQPGKISMSEGLDCIMDMLHQMGREIHKTAHNLLPDILQKHSLPEALQLYCAQLEGADDLQIALHFQGNLEHLDKSVKLSLYRIIQELVQNTVKYAHATKAAVQIRRDKDILHISVEDDGSGFERCTGKGLGLQNIETRIRMLNGYFSIESVPGMGTTAYIELDLRKIPQPKHEHTYQYSG